MGVRKNGGVHMRGRRPRTIEHPPLRVFLAPSLRLQILLFGQPLFGFKNFIKKFCCGKLFVSATKNVIVLDACVIVEVRAIVE